MAKPAPLDCKIQPACLPNPAWADFPTNVNSSAWIAGWGDLTSGGEGPETLQNINITLYDGPSMCALVSKPKDWNKQICAGIYKL